MKFEGPWTDEEEKTAISMSEVDVFCHKEAQTAYQDKAFFVIKKAISVGRQFGFGNTVEEAVADFWSGYHKMITIDPVKLAHTFSKHAQDFGILGPWNKANAALLEQAIQVHVNHPAVQKIPGTYRGTRSVTHYFDVATDLWVAVDASNNFVAGWKLSPAQKAYLLSAGNVQ